MTIVEEPHNGKESLDEANLQYRLDQQRILSDFGAVALRSHDVDALLQQACELCSKGMRTTLAKVVEFKRNPERLCVRAGVGWKPGVVGELEIGADMESPAGFAFKTGVPVISNQLGQEERFRTPKFLAEHGVKRAINVLIEVGSERFGVLEVDSRNEGRFEEADLAFMQGFASLIGVALERQRAEARLQESVKHQELLTREASHRVKNSLAMVSSMLSLQRRSDENEDVARMLGDAQARIETIAQAHDLLWRGKTVGMVDLNELICDLAEKLVEQAPEHELNCNVAPIQLSADVAIPLGLIVTELVTNAMKYAYDGHGGTIDVTVVADGETIELTVADGGPGLPKDFEFETRIAEGLGTRMIASLARQLRGRVNVEDAEPGARVRLVVPSKS